MSEREVGVVPVIKRERVAGIFTERDVVSRVGPLAWTLPQRVGAVMSTNMAVADMAPLIGRARSFVRYCSFGSA